MSLLDLAHAALAVALACKAHVPGDGEDVHEDNTFGLPDGAPIRRRMRRFFRDQLQQVAGHVATIGGPLDHPLPRMGAWDVPMADAMTPVLGVYYDRAGRAVRGRIGLDPAGWRVTDPNVHAAVKAQALTFCAATNATTDLGIAAARDGVREALARGLIGTGQTTDELTARVRQVFTRASKSRAETIARTEASRAVHAASILSAEASGVVAGKRWLLSANSCPECVRVAKASGLLPLDGTFAHAGKNPDYAITRFPPLHPRCRCSLAFDLAEEPPDHAPDREPRGGEGGSGTGGGGGSGGRAGGLAREFLGLGRGTLPGGRSTRRRVVAWVARAAVARQVRNRVIRPAIEGAAVAHRRRVAARVAATPKPPSPPIAGVTRIPPGPIADRIKDYMDGAGKAKLEALANLDANLDRDKRAAEKARVDALKALDKLRKSKGYAHPDTLAVDALVKAATDRADALRDVTRRNAFRAAEVLAVDPAGRAVIASGMVTPGRPIPGVTRDAEGFLGQVLAADADHPRGLKVEYGVARTGRAFYSPKDRRINLAGGEPASIVVHEFGHAIEMQWSKVFDRASEFLTHRVGAEKLRKLKDIFPRRGYDGHERARKDKFDQAFADDASDAWYCGKEYRRNVRDPKTRDATEIIAMGVQKVMQDPVTFARKDPEYCAFIMGILDGSLR